MLEQLDQERLNIAAASDAGPLKTIFEHFAYSFHVPLDQFDSISAMNQAIYAAGNDVYGPNTADSRYITEDVPFGLVPTVVLGRLVGQPAVLHQAGIALISAMYGRDFAAENDLLKALQLDSWSLAELQTAAKTGVLPQRILLNQKEREETNEAHKKEEEPKRPTMATESMTQTTKGKQMAG